MIRVSASTFGLIAALLIAGWPRAGGSELLANGGFEAGISGWAVSAGTLDTVDSPVHAGALAARFSGSGQPTTQFAYQVVDIQSAQSYELSGWVSGSSSGLGRAFLRVSWFDQGGQLVSSEDSPWLSQPDGAFHPLTTGARTSPAAARQARVSVLVQADSAFSVHLDDFVFAGPAAIPPPPATTPPTPVVTPPPAPPTATPLGAPPPVPSPTRPPVGATAGPTLAPAVEPGFFSDLVNGGFEQLRLDGTPYAWRKQGGEMRTVSEPRIEGLRALALTSATSSTKWVHQTVNVGGGLHYEASVVVLAGPGSESAFLRLSWYASEDGSGQAISSVDSLEAELAGDGGFQMLTTGPVKAPPGAASLKFRLMLRPVSEGAAAAYFDSAALRQTPPGFAGGVTAQGGAGSARRNAAGGRQVAEAGRAVLPGDATVGGATPIELANVKPARGVVGQPAASGQGRDDWAIVLALGIALVAIGLAGGYELWQRRSGGSGGPGSEV
ncbi:MAG TPA: carbohydrate binding domain-containing protein [Dehalococcoidia bacterium]|nr:carbohydrate binding domain-containing protein [Dehalococcoidia bacterium]